ncbi:hypothetical protein CPHLJ_5g5490 [Cryptosporidium parvum]
MFIKSKILLSFIYFMFLFENVADEFYLSRGGGRGGKKPVLRSMTSLPLKGSEKSSHCHHHHKDKHCHGKKKHIVHQHIPSKPKGKNTIRLLRTLRMKDPDDPEKNPSDMPSDEPHHNPDDDEEPCDGDDYDDDELCDDEEEEEKYQKEKEKEENEDKHDQLDSKNKHKSRSRGSGKHFSKKVCGPCKNINMEDL